MIDHIEVDEEKFEVKKSTLLTKLKEIVWGKKPETKWTPTPRKHDWKDWELEYLKENHGHLKLKEMAVFLDRPISTIYSKMQREGIIKKEK